MTILEKIWILISVAIIFIILLTEPKTPVGNTSFGSQFSGLFESASDGQKFIKQLNWILIVSFFLITTALSYFE